MITDYVELIRSRCKEDASGCHIWQGAVHRQGYGFCRHGKKMKTIQRILAIELNLFPDIDFKSRVGNTCNNKLCGNPDHIICQTHTEVMNRNYRLRGTGAQFDTDEKLLAVKEEYLALEGTKGIVEILAKKYGCGRTLIYRTISKANHLI